MIDRTNPEEVKVTLEDGYALRFWVTGLTDEEYIRRTTLIREREKSKSNDICRRDGCGGRVYSDGLCNYHFSV